MDSLEDVEKDAPDAEITSPEEFRRALGAMLAEADSNGVDVRGGWPVLRGEASSWDVEIIEMSLR